MKARWEAAVMRRAPGAQLRRNGPGARCSPGPSGRKSALAPHGRILIAARRRIGRQLSPTAQPQMLGDDPSEIVERRVAQRADELLRLAAGLVGQRERDVECEGVNVGHSGLRLLMSPDGCELS